MIPPPATWAMLLAAFLFAGTARAQPTSSGAAACADAFERGQVERNDGKLLEARRDFLACAQDSCPTVVKRQCVTFHAEVAGAVPSIVVAAKDRAGADVADVRLTVDGAFKSERLDGKPIELDPGEHRVRLERSGIAPVEQTIVIAEGERARVLRIALPIGEAPTSGPPPSETPSDDGPGLILAGVGFGIAGAALIAAIVTGVIAMRDGEKCDPPGIECDDQYIKDHQPIAHASTACFAVAGAGAIVGIVGVALFVTAAEPGADAGGLKLGVTLRGAF